MGQADKLPKHGTSVRPAGVGDNGTCYQRQGHLMRPETNIGDTGTMLPVASGIVTQSCAWTSGTAATKHGHLCVLKLCLGKRACYQNTEIVNRKLCLGTTGHATKTRDICASRNCAWRQRDRLLKHGTYGHITIINKPNRSDITPGRQQRTLRTAPPRILSAANPRRSFARHRCQTGMRAESEGVCLSEGRHCAPARKMQILQRGMPDALPRFPERKVVGVASPTRKGPTRGISVQGSRARNCGVNTCG
ncbi:hypothetical protein AVEN_221462-1 [Araneus ventricosus]|uniref:Uncharacterized protein n=1 Tax=Araneus ventricosus TaxID=182803 RepID=A0A4Y2T357_ARAVE|nr:hypothetical protein AVEN_221462-1 [Araneus ventricosus]